MACEFCKRFDFSTAKIEVDKYSARILLALCNTKFDAEEQFKYCPNCGEILIKKYQDREAYFIVDKNSKDAWVSSKPISYLTIGELEGIDKDGRYFSTREKALKNMGK